MWPDDKVAEEVATIPFTEEYADFWDWMSAIEKLNEKLVIARD